MGGSEGECGFVESERSVVETLDFADLAAISRMSCRCVFQRRQGTCSTLARGLLLTSHAYVHHVIEPKG
jgi:hypothetical protein